MLTAAHRAVLDQAILDDIIRREGSAFVDHPADPGGPTRWGVTLEALRHYKDDPALTAEHVKSLSREVAIDVLYRGYIQGFNFQLLNSPLIYAFVLDCSVNHGPPRAGILLQKACRVTADGMVGPVTAKAANALPETTLLLRVIAERIKFYVRICKNDPSRIVFLEGWIKHRCLDFIPYAHL
jgi:lysozyme family protein